MKTYSITLLTSEGVTRAEIPQKLLLELINKINENGKEMVHTTKSFEVTGIVIGDVKGKVLIL